MQLKWISLQKFICDRTYVTVKTNNFQSYTAAFSEVLVLESWQKDNNILSLRNYLMDQKRLTSMSNFFSAPGFHENFYTLFTRLI